MSPTKCFLLFRVSMLTLFSSLLAPGVSHASEPLFGYTYTTDLAPRGKFEIEQWVTDREGQAHGTFHHVDMRSEVEYGITDNLQFSVYANYVYADESANSVNHRTEGIEIPYDHDPAKRYQSGRYEGLSFELIYRVLSPYLDPVGLAFYVEPEFGPRARGIEFRSILQKNFFDDQLVLAANLWVEFEKEAGSNLTDPNSTDLPDGAFHDASYAELDLGASYRIASNWSTGLEFREHNEFSGFTFNHDAQDHVAYFLGPSIHYASEHWFATFSILRQLGATAFTDEQRAQTYKGLLYGDEHTAWDGIRLKLGFPM
jgi:hypothetical protein